MTANSHYELTGTQVWPTMFFHRRWSMYSQEAPSIIAYLKQLKGEQAESIDSGVAIGAKSSHGLYESHFDLFSNPNASLQRLVKFIASTLALAVCIANEQESNPQDVEIEFADSWYHITNDGGFHDAHVHDGCSWCGIYYLELGASGHRKGRSAPNGGSRFYSPLTSGGHYRDYGNKYLFASIDPPLENGMLLLFPSYLMHSGLPYRGDTDRVVIAFNAKAFLKEGALPALHAG